MEELEHDYPRGKYLRQIYDVLKGYPKFIDWTVNRYRPACEKFAAVQDWMTVDEKTLYDLIAESDNGIAPVKLGKTISGGVWRPKKVNVYREIARDIVAVRNAANEKIIEVSGVCRERFYGLYTRRPHVIFNRILAGLLPEHFVNVPEMPSLGKVYQWLSGKTVRCDENTWASVSMLVQLAMSCFLPDLDLYDRGSLTWCIAERYKTGNREGGVQEFRDYIKKVFKQITGEE